MYFGFTFMFDTHNIQNNFKYLPKGETRINVAIYRIYAQLLMGRCPLPLTNSIPTQNVMTNL